ncbi:hypothetical protein KM043_000384 [Ampulex compressa]|nr:hypothetical protein KM043_000384 [Ampulex compressa]
MSFGGIDQRHFPGPRASKGRGNKREEKKGRESEARGLIGLRLRAVASREYGEQACKPARSCRERGLALASSARKGRSPLGTIRLRAPPSKIRTCDIHGRTVIDLARSQRRLHSEAHHRPSAFGKGKGSLSSYA